MYGTWTTQTGAEHKPAAFHAAPDTAVGGGPAISDDQTVVEVEKVEISDDTTSRSTRPYRYAPALMYWPVGGRQFDPTKLQVRVCVRVLHHSLSPGALGWCSANPLTWRPNESKWLRMAPRPGRALC